jgi:hypothetical protein
MTPTKILTDTLAELLAGDVAYLAAAAAKHVHLIAEPFSPGPELDFTTLTEATFAGSAALIAAAGAQQAFTDPLTAQRVTQLIEPLGGWHWECTADPALPETIYGVILTDLADLVTLGGQLFDAPITIGEAGQAIDVDQVRFTFPVQPIG